MNKFREYTIRDLKEFGIGHLTGESCAISLRILYDLTAQGTAHIENALSIKIADDSSRNWNSKVGNIKAVKSIKMSYAQAHDVLICILATQWDVVVEFTPNNDADIPSYLTTGTILMAGNTEGYNAYMELPSSFIEDNYWARYYVKPTQDAQPSIGLDNTHAFSNRT